MLRNSMLVILALVAAPLRADDLAEKGRALFNKYQHAVVTVQLVLKSKFSVGGQGGQANESRQDVTGTVMDPSGLTVWSLSATDQTTRLAHGREASTTMTTPDAPAFNLGGKPAGISVMRALKAKSGGGLSMFNLQPENLTAIIVPADDILKAAKQVPAAGEE